ncbi:MAG: tetrameric acyl-CoA thioesterase, partial [Thermomonas sp.]
DDAELDELRAATASGQKAQRWFDADVLDAQGELVARTRKQLYVRRKPGR